MTAPGDGVEASEFPPIDDGFLEGAMAEAASGDNEGDGPGAADLSLEAEPGARPFSLPASAIVWATAGLIFLATHLGPVWRLQVAGAEWANISGAWQAHIGVSDDRFVATLFQALTTGIFSVNAEVLPARVLAAIATLSVPIAIWMVRGRLGVAGAAFALVLLALDGPSSLTGTSASAMGFDIAIVAWLFAAATLETRRSWVWAVLAALVVAGGPIPLPLVAAFLILRLARGGSVDTRLVAVAVAGAAVGAGAASFGFGFGGVALRVPAFVTFSQGFSAAWAVPSTGDLFLFYQVPLVVLAVTGLSVAARDLRRDGLQSDQALALIWFALSLLWVVVSWNTNNPAPLVSLAFAAAVCAGPFISDAIEDMVAADWYWARWLVPAAGFLLIIVAANVVDWARLEKVGAVDTELAVVLCGGGAVLALGWLGFNRDSAPTVLAPIFGMAALWMVAANLGAAIGVDNQPLVGPELSSQSAEIRELALATIADRGGEIVVHPDFAADVTWPFRDTRTLIVASRVPPDAGFVIWPATLAAPEGLTRLDGTWSLRELTQSPSASLLRYLHWLVDRNILSTVRPGVAIYQWSGK